jgi:hypothetical protein
MALGLVIVWAYEISKGYGYYRLKLDFKLIIHRPNDKAYKLKKPAIRCISSRIAGEIEISTLKRNSPAQHHEMKKNAEIQ